MSLCDLPDEIIRIICVSDPKCYGVMYLLNKRTYKVAQSVDPWALFTRCYSAKYLANPSPFNGEIQVHQHICEIYPFYHPAIPHGFQKTISSHVKYDGSVVSRTIKYSYVVYGVVKYSRSMIYKYYPSGKRYAKYLYNEIKHKSNGSSVFIQYDSKGNVCRRINYDRDGKEYNISDRVFGAVCVGVVFIAICGFMFRNQK